MSGSVALKRIYGPGPHVTSILNLNDTACQLVGASTYVAALRSRAAPRPPVLSMTACGGKPVELGDGDWLGVAVCDEGTVMLGLMDCVGVAVGVRPPVTDCVGDPDIDGEPVWVRDPV